jgi:MEDS: MEthanogen/methylotroph, DcmR Sensory domain
MDSSADAREENHMKQTNHQSIRLAGSTIQPPCHACAFFHGESEWYEVLLPFIKEGVDQGEKSFHIIDERRRAAHMNRLRGGGIDPSAETTGQLEIRGWENTLFRPGWFDQHAMLAFIEEVLRNAKEKGYAHTRFIGDMGWALEDKPGVEHQAEFCARVNYLVPKYHATLICAYDMAQFSAAQLVDVLRSHALALIGGVLQENPFFTPPDQLIREFQEPRQYS